MDGVHLPEPATLRRTRRGMGRVPPMDEIRYQATFPLGEQVRHGPREPDAIRALPAPCVYRPQLHTRCTCRLTHRWQIVPTRDPRRQVWMGQGIEVKRPSLWWVRLLWVWPDDFQIHLWA